MMRREVCSMRPSLAALFLAGCMCVSLREAGAEAEHAHARKIPKVEIKLNGPAAIRPSESLETQFFKATLTNRSAEPLVLFVREGFLLNARWNWTVTDAKGELLGMAFVNRGFCGTVPYSEEAAKEASRVHDKDLVVLEPGESREFPVPGGPSDDYNFPEAGTYKFAVTLTYVVPNSTFFFDENGKKQAAPGFEQWDLSQLSVNGLEKLRSSLPVHATSAAWDLALPNARIHRGEVAIIPNLPVLSQ